MKKVYRIAVLFILLCFGGFFSCQKKLTGHVEVTGRVLDYFTNEPISVRVTLQGDDATSAKQQTQASISLASTMSNTDGTFKLRSRPSKRGNYYISIEGGTFEKINLKENQTLDLGDCLAGTHDFYCDITVIPQSDSSLRVQKTYLTNDYHSFPKGTTATVRNTITLTSKSFNGYNKSFPIWYSAHCSNPPYYSTSYYKYVPITSLNSVLTTTIYY
jgi:hypothetical protein